MPPKSRPPPPPYALQGPACSSSSGTAVYFNLVILNGPTDRQHGNTMQIKTLNTTQSAHSESSVAGVVGAENYGAGTLQSHVDAVDNAETKIGMRGGYCAGGSSDSKDSGDYGLPTPPATPFNSPTHHCRNRDIETAKSAKRPLSPSKSGVVKRYGTHSPVYIPDVKEEDFNGDSNRKEERVCERKYRVWKGSEGRRYRWNGGRGGDFWPERRNNAGKELFSGIKEGRGSLAGDRKIWGDEWKSDKEGEKKGYPDEFIKVERDY